MTAIPPRDYAPLRRFVAGIADLVEHQEDTGRVLSGGAALLGELLAEDVWLDDAFAQPGADRYQQYLLHCDSRARFSVVSFVWGPGQSTPIHDHRVWGLVGVLRGAERVERFVRSPEGALLAVGEPVLLTAGQVDTIDPQDRDIHRVANGVEGGVSVSIHVYGANIGAVSRATYDASGQEKPFVSGYANALLPNIWEGSAA